MQKTWRSTLLVAYTLAILAFLYLPLFILTLYSFNDSRINAVWAGFTLKWYASLLSNDRVLEALTNSLLIASITTVVTTIMGTFAAIALHRYQYRSKTVLNSLLYLPILIPEIVMGLSLLILFSQLGLSLGKPTLIVAHITFCLPYVIFNVTPKLKQLDIKLYEAALDLGCDPRQAFFKVILPEISPAILSAFLICLTYSIDDFMISYFNCGTVETLPIAIYSMTRKKVSPEIYALSTIMFVVILTIILISNAMESREYRRDQRALRGEDVK